MVAGTGSPKILLQCVKPMEGEITFCTYIAPYVTAKGSTKGVVYNHFTSKARLVF